MDPDALYAAKLTTPEEAVAGIAPGARLSIGMAMSEPPALLKALADRIEAGGLAGVSLFYFEATAIAGDTVLRYELGDRIRRCCMFVAAPDRALIKRGGEDDGRKIIDFLPNNFHQASRILTENVDVDTFLVTVSPMDRHGYFSLGLGNDYSSVVARHAKRLVVEVNKAMPRVGGAGAMLHVSEVTAIVENHIDLLELPTRGSGATDGAIGKLIAEMVPDGACLQMGVGSLPNEVCSALAQRNDLGVHTECLNPGLVALIRSGAVTNRRKALNRGVSVFTFAMGQRSMYDFLDGNPGIESHPVAYVNDPCVVARNDGVVSINATVQIDLTGACNSEHMLGHQFSASGGQLDFVRGAYASKGGKSIIATASTAAHGKVSKIVARLDGPVTVPRIDTHYVVTEYGVVNLRGMTSSDRARQLIALAHPDLRDALTEDAKALHLL